MSEIEATDHLHAMVPAINLFRTWYVVSVVYLITSWDNRLH